MIGDKIIIQPNHRRMSSKILSEFFKKYKKPQKIIIVIAGISGTGKTECSRVIQETLWEKYKIRSKNIHIADCCFTEWNDRNKIRKSTGIIGKEEINFKKLNRVLKDFKSKKRKLYVQRIHKFLNAIEYSISPNKCIDVLIVEGIYALYVDRYDFGVYIDTKIEDTYKFRKLRMKENPDSKFRKTVLQKESNCVYQSKNRANLIIPYEKE